MSDTEEALSEVVQEAVATDTPTMAEISQYKTAQEAYRKILLKDLPVPGAPDEGAKERVNKFHEESVGDLNDQELMKIMGLLTGFLAYAEWELAKSDVEQAIAYSVRDFSLAHVMLQAPKTYTSVKEREAWSKEKPVCTESQAEYLQSYAMFTYLKGLAKSLERKFFVCSRELSRRQARPDSEKRGFTT